MNNNKKVCYLYVCKKQCTFIKQNEKMQIRKKNVEIYFGIFMNPFKFSASKNFEIPFRCTFHKTVVLQL